VVSAIVFEPPPKLSALCPDAPEGLEFVLNKAMEKEAARRLQDAGDLKQALSLCRLTIGLGPLSSSAGQTAPASPAEAPDDEGKTRVMKRPLRPAAPPAFAAPKAPVAPQDPTVLKSAAPGNAPPSAQPAPSRTAPPPARPAPGAVRAPQYRYCPSCTTANRPDAPVCVGCGLPLDGGVQPVAKPSRSWALYAAIVVAVLLFLSLVIVLIVKQ
jgi:hypothetical protein